MRRHVIPSLLLALLVGLVAWFLQMPSTERPEGAAPEPSAGAQASSAKPQDAAPAAGARRELLPDGPVSEAPDALDPETQAAWDGEGGILVRVLSAGDGEPAGGALVHVLDSADHEQGALRDAMRAAASAEAVVEELGLTYRTDADGSVLLPPRRSFVMLVARLDGKVGSATLEHEPDGTREEVEIALVRRLELGVRVLRADGSPAPGCRVSFFIDRLGHHDSQRDAFTDEDGRVRLFDLQRALERLGSGHALWCAVSEPLAAPVAVELFREQWPEQELMLQLPPTGSVVVRLQDATGAPLTGERAVVLQRLPEEADPTGARHRLRSHFHGGHRRSASDGSARFPYVSPGLPLEAYARLDESGVPTAAEGAGPDAPGATSEILLCAEQPPAVVVVRVVDGDGRPRGDEDFLVTRRRVDPEGVNTSQTGREQTDAKGMLRVALGEPDLPQGWTRRLELQQGGFREPDCRWGSLDLPPRLDRGENPLGELQVGGMPVIDGIVVDAEGDAALPEVSVGVVLERYGWPTRVATTGSDGRFRFDGPLAEDAVLRLRVTAPPGYLDQEISFERPHSGLRVVLARDTTLRGRVLLDEGVPLELLDISAQAVTAAADGSRWWTGAIPESRGSTAFHLEGIPPGVEFEVQVATTLDEEVLWTGRFLLRPGEQAEPEELHPLDLRGRLRMHRLIVTRADGEPVPPVSWAYRDGDRVRTGRTSGDRIELLSTREALDLTVWTPSCMPRNLRLAGTQEIELEPGPRLKLRVTMPEIPAGSRVLLDWLREDPDPVRGRIRAGPIELPADGNMELRLPESGAWRVQAFLVPEGARGPHYRHRFATRITDALLFSVRAGATLQFDLSAPTGG